MKTMLKLTLMIALLGSTVMADGDMGNGKSVCTVNCPPPPMVQQAGEDTAIQADTVYISTDVVLDIVKDTLDMLF